MDIKNATLLTLSLTGGIGIRESIAQNRQRPNIVVIITDQQQVGKMSYMGDRGLSTPTMDRIARNGYAFTNAYCTFPLSIPQRFSLFTGMYPSTFNLRFNPDKKSRNEVDMAGIEALRPRMLASLFNEAGYDTFYGGKAHLVSREINEDPEFYGFQSIYSRERRGQLGPDAAAFLATKSLKDKPFLMIVSYINPHDICEYDDFIDYDRLTPSVRNRKAEGLKRVRKYVDQTSKYTDQTFYADICPPLPDNHARMKGEPVGLPGKIAPYTERQWRMHRWVYNRLVEEVDSDIAPVMDALDKGGFLENTILVFISDHGEMDASHLREHKSVPFQEAQNVPFIIAGPGIERGVIDRKTVINAGIDLMPTLCDLAHIPVPENIPGRSVKPVITGEKKGIDRRYIFCEGFNWFQVLEDNRYKYTVLETEGNPEILVDLKNDPGETTNLAGTPRYEKIRTRLARILIDDLRNRGIRLKYANENNR